jgi:hypothetical protein
MQIGFIWLTVRNSGVSYKDGNEPSGSINAGISRLAD